MENYRLRRSARVFLFEESTGDVLLIRFEAELKGQPFVFWVTPGGEIEPGEDERAAAERELVEELSLQALLTGPVHRESGGTYTHLGETVRNQDVFFAAICAREDPVLGGVTHEEIALMREARWWKVAEIRDSNERIFPAGIAAIVERVWRELKGSPAT